jgi:hypothetical protein
MFFPDNITVGDRLILRNTHYSLLSFLPLHWIHSTGFDATTSKVMIPTWPTMIVPLIPVSKIFKYAKLCSWLGMVAQVYNPSYSGGKE